MCSWWSEPLAFHFALTETLSFCRSDENGIATDPNSIKVGGDIKMDLDLNEAIKEDARLQEAGE